MPRTCTICSNPDIQGIDQALVAGTPYRTVAERFEISPPSLYRHWQGHLPATLLKAREVQDVAHADNLMAQLQSLQQKALEILNHAEGSGDLRSALSALRELRGTVELTARLTGQMSTGRQPQVMEHPRPYADVPIEQLEAVVAKLAELEGTS